MDLQYLVWFILSTILFAMNWKFAEETGSKFQYFVMVLCGVAALVNILRFGGII